MGVTESLYSFSAISLSKRVKELDVSDQFDGYSGVEITVDDETVYFAGTEDGRILRVTNVWGTQQMADDMLEQIEGFQYQPMDARGALLDPAAEIGDGVSMKGVYSGICTLNRDYTSLMATDIAAPQDEEIDHEYPFETSENREINRRFTSVQSELNLASNEISAKVSQTGGDNSSFGWNLLSDHFSLYSGSKEVFRVDSSGASVQGVITATSGVIGGFTIGNRAIYNNIPDFNNSGGISSGVYLGTDGIRLGQNFTVSTSGNVTANNMKLTGTLTVGDSQITANNLRLGASRANGGYAGWNQTKEQWDNATKSRSYTGYFRCGTLYCDAMITTVDFISVNGLSYSGRYIEIDGVAWRILARPF